MRTDASGRPFPYVRYAFRTLERKFILIPATILFVAGAVWISRSMPAEPMQARVVGYAVLAFLLSAIAGLPARAGFFDVFPNRVSIRGGATSVRARVSLEQAAFLVVAAACLVFGATFIAHFGLVDLVRGGPRTLMLGPGFAGLGIWGLADFARNHLRSITMTPEAITYRRGFKRIALAWDELGDAISTDDVFDHRGNRAAKNKYVPGAKIVVPADRLAESKLPVYMDGTGAPRLLLETNHLSVEPSALLTAILALRDHRELRRHLGTRESKRFFVGPSWWARRQMHRHQEWWPGGVTPTGATADTAGAESTR